MGNFNLRRMITARHHRRSSSKWIPPSAPLHNPMSIFRSRASREQGGTESSPLKKKTLLYGSCPDPQQNGTNISVAFNFSSRMIQPNHLFDEPRYDLNNYRQFTNNSITTTKYSLLTFIPYNIIHQMCTKYANIYFLFIALLNFCPLFAAFTRFLGLVPISFVLGTTLIKDGFEDLRRWRYDNKINNNTCHVWDRDRQMFRKMQWKHILVGDFVHVSNEQDIPADVLFLRSSDENATCFVETSNLDGETSLKQRVVPRQYLSFSEPDSKFMPSQFTGTVFCEPPDPAIYTVRAKIEYEPGCFEVVTKDNMLLRGSRLRNTTWIEGIVLYAGHDTKVMMNNGRTPHKISGIEQLTNKFIIVCVFILIAMVLGSSLMSGIWTVHHPPSNSKSPSVPDPFVVWDSPTPFFEGLYNVGTFVICYQVIVPISLYITVEIIKAAQIYILSQDIELYDEESDRPVDCRSLNIPEELGQVTHILSDKTGTLTENIMVFRNCAFDRKDYGPGNLRDVDPTQPVASVALQARVKNEWRTNTTMKHFFYNMVLNNSVVVNKTPHHDELEVGYFEHGVYNIGNSSFFDITFDQFTEMVANLKKQASIEERPDSLANLPNLPEIPEEDEIGPFTPASPRSFTPVSSDSEKEAPPPLTPLSLISKGSLTKFVRRNIIHPIQDLIPYASIRKLRHETLLPQEEFCPYEAESPDELALILGAKLYGFTLEDKAAAHIKISLPDGSKENVPILHVLPFHSGRKRMSIVLDTPAGPLLYCKGADSAILPRLRRPTEEESIHCSKLKERLDEYSCRGLRTLAFGMRLLNHEEWDEFMESYRFVRHNRSGQLVQYGRGLDIWMMNLQAMSVTSNDRDELLSQKADEIEKDLELLGVTGIEDRLQDGVEETIIAMRSAGIQVWVLTGDKLETAENIARSCGLFSPNRETRKIETLEDVTQIRGDGFNLILSPQATLMAKAGEQSLLSILKKAKAVLCYRMTPAEKAEIVKCVKTRLKGRVLAIGDGANDVPMIQAAHVGIGVAGKEGMQAAMACDFAIARFRFLRRLLLVHGHWCYDRLALTFLFFLYKNTNNVFILFFFQFYDGWSAAFTNDPTYTILYPIIFSAVQPIIVGVFDQDRSAEDLLEDPSLYSSGRKGTKYTFSLFALSVIDGIWQAAVVYYVAHWTFVGYDCGLWTFGFYTSTGVMLTNAAHLSIEVRCWTLPIAVIFVFFIGLHYAYFIVYGFVVQAGWVHNAPILVPLEAMMTVDFWLYSVIVTVIAVFPRFACRCLWNTLFDEENRKTK